MHILKFKLLNMHVSYITAQLHSYSMYVCERACMHDCQRRRVEEEKKKNEDVIIYRQDDDQCRRK